MTDDNSSNTGYMTIEFRHPILSSVIMFTFMLLALALNLGLVWYERLTRSSPKHTLVNTMAAASAAYNSGLITSMLTPLIIKAAFMENGLPVIACRSFAFFVAFSAIQVNSDTTVLDIRQYTMLNVFFLRCYWPMLRTFACATCTLVALEQWASSKRVLSQPYYCQLTQSLAASSVSSLLQSWEITGRHLHIAVETLRQNSMVSNNNLNLS